MQVSHTSWGPKALTNHCRDRSTDSEPDCLVMQLPASISCYRSSNSNDKIHPNLFTYSKLLPGRFPLHHIRRRRLVLYVGSDSQSRFNPRSSSLLRIWCRLHTDRAPCRWIDNDTNVKPRATRPFVHCPSLVLFWWISIEGSRIRDLLLLRLSPWELCCLQVLLVKMPPSPYNFMIT